MANEITGNPWNEFSKTRKCLYTVGADRPGFHGDLQLIEIVENCIANGTKIFIETGAYHGCTSYYVAANFDLLCYSCELIEDNFNIAKINTQQFSNLNLFHNNSLDFLKDLIKNNPNFKNQKTIFWLDAHGDQRNSGPILQEIEFIKTQFTDYIIFVDDVNTPNSKTNEQFDLEYLSKIYDAYDTYYIPTYTEKTGYSLTGWIMISSEDLGILPHCEKFDF